MELAKIEILLEKYLEAKTTLAEESILKKYFSQEDVPVHLLEYKELFNYFSDDALDILNQKIVLPVAKTNLKWLSIAAAVVLFVSIFSLYQNDLVEKREAQQAYLETQKALNLISQSLNKGGNAIAQLQVFENTQNKIFKK
ncbi:MAG: hypothetical protein KAT78_00770 [Flavobacteriaceae bacterium]|nr:hypothetical protein [Flavobacteriaceae bacterium]